MTQPKLPDPTQSQSDQTRILLELISKCCVLLYFSFFFLQVVFLPSLLYDRNEDSSHPRNNDSDSIQIINDGDSVQKQRRRQRKRSRDFLRFFFIIHLNRDSNWRSSSSSSIHTSWQVPFYFLVPPFISSDFEIRLKIRENCNLKRVMFSSCIRPVSQLATIRILIPSLLANTVW